jgi:hypothetical protein
MPGLTHDRVTEYIGFLKSIGELPSPEESEARLQEDILRYIHGLGGSFDLILSEVILQSEHRHDVVDYFVSERETERHTVRRVKDIAEALDKEQYAVTRAVNSLVGLVFMRPIKWRGHGDYVDCYPPVINHLGKKLAALTRSHNVSAGPKARAMMTVCTRHKYSKSTFSMTNGLEALYAPELIAVLPAETDVKLTIDVTPQVGHMEVILKTPYEFSDAIWQELESIVRIQTRAHINRMTYNPERGTVLGSENITDAIRKIDPSESCTCTEPHCRHFTVLPSDGTGALVGNL